MSNDFLPFRIATISEEYIKLVESGDSEAMTEKYFDLHDRVVKLQHLERQMAEIKTYFETTYKKHIAKEGWYAREGFIESNPLRFISYVVDMLIRERDKSNTTLGSLIEHIVTHLTAMRMIAESCFGNNHTIRNQRMHVLMDIIDRAKGEFVQDRGDPTRFHYDPPFTRDSFDVRRMAAENYKLRRRIEQQNKDIEELKSKLPSPAPDSAENDPNYIPF